MKLLREHGPLLLIAAFGAIQIAFLIWAVRAYPISVRVVSDRPLPGYCP